MPQTGVESGVIAYAHTSNTVLGAKTLVQTMMRHCLMPTLQTLLGGTDVRCVGAGYAALAAEVADTKQAAMDATEAVLRKNQSAMRFGTVDRWETMFPSGPLKNAQRRTLRAKAATGMFMDRWVNLALAMCCVVSSRQAEQNFFWGVMLGADSATWRCHSEGSHFHLH